MDASEGSKLHEKDAQDTVHRQNFQKDLCDTSSVSWQNIQVPIMHPTHPVGGLNQFWSFGTLQQAQYHQAASAQAAAMAQTIKLVKNENQTCTVNQPVGMEPQAMYERQMMFPVQGRDYIIHQSVENMEKIQGPEASFSAVEEKTLDVPPKVNVLLRKRYEKAKEATLNGLSELHIDIHNHDKVQKDNLMYSYQIGENSVNYDSQKPILQNYYTSTRHTHNILNSANYNQVYTINQKENAIHPIINPYIEYTNTSKNFFKKSFSNQNIPIEYHETIKKSVYPCYSAQNNDLLKNKINIQPFTISTEHILQNPTPLIAHYESGINKEKYYQKQAQYFKYTEDMLHRPQHCYKSSLFVPQAYTRPISLNSNFPSQIKRQNEKYQVLRSPLLDEFRNNKNKKYKLKDIFGHIVEFSGDQHGSRFIQQALEGASAEDKEIVFQEIFPNSLQLMTDVFGNYVIQKFMEHGDQMQKTLLLEQMKGHVLTLSLQTYGCRVVQKALEYIQIDQKISLVKELNGNVLKCIKNQNGNHVIQKIIEKVPIEHIQFLINTFQGQIYVLATHPYGCRVIQRMLEYCSQTRDLIKELHLYAQNLIRDQYGNYCIQHIIEKGEPEDRSKIISVVKGNVFRFSKHKFASNVVEKCITYGTDEEKKLLIDEIIESNENGMSFLLPMIKDQYANYVIKKALDVACDDQRNKLISEIKPHLQFLKKNVHGKALSSNIERLITLSNNQFVQDNEAVAET
ncbi:uncharacterized protein T551_00023 [Pneumocystis jirovecii RU7]|uniref:Pumilio homology domain family member 3 n=1 Tax=Pneumocystis jirovecii (strain RU7) TaxID=1408657 RepID=A0A0W4ZVY4_PNEJ7|nr:uncharacterized protein T551_00023 [Pneumocystis jirovecii RU7]KTW32538.1 hypothetical protein T551_00023 [Pneumocystis jirovecii RU7]